MKIQYLPEFCSLGNLLLMFNAKFTGTLKTFQRFCYRKLPCISSFLQECLQQTMFRIHPSGFSGNRTEGGRCCFSLTLSTTDVLTRTLLIISRLANSVTKCQGSRETSGKYIQYISYFILNIVCCLIHTGTIMYSYLIQNYTNSF